MLPLRLRVFARLLALIDRESLADLSPEDVARASAERSRLIRRPGAWLVVGRRDSRVDIRDRRIAVTSDGASLELTVRVYRPKVHDSAPLPVIVNFHGGGFVSGDAQQSEWWCSSISAEVGAVVVSVEYRLAPATPFPGPPEDCYAATCWVAEHAAELGVDPGRIAVMGDSAGGNLAAVVALLARDRGGPGLALQVLIYPAVEMVRTFASRIENEHAPVLSGADIDGFARLYLAGGDGADIRWSPLRASHEDVAPALIQTAQYDPLRDQGTAYAQALLAAGVPARLTNYVEAAHGFISMPGLVPVARQALAEAVTALRDAFDISAPARPVEG